MRSVTDVEAFFNPQSIAVIGASDDPTKIGGRPIRNLQLGGFKGKILPINPRHRQVQGLDAYASLSEIGQSIDLAIISVPAHAVPAAVEASAVHGVKAAIVFSAGFSEASSEGEAAQRQIVASARAHGLRLLGPNCMGTINTRAGVLATFTSGILENAPAVGRISLASQSGAFGSHCLSLMRERGLALNLWATTGNQCDVEVADFLAYMATDPNTDVIIGSIEGVHDASRLVQAFELAQRNKKPLIVMKVGTSDAGAAAMASHTASLAGSDQVFDAVARRYGVYRAHSIDELMDVAYACSHGRIAESDRLGVVTVSGGVGVLMADTAEEVGLTLPELPEPAQQALRELVPFAGTRNPVDVTAQILNDPDLIEPMMTLLLGKGDYSSVIIFLSHLGLNPAIIAKLMPGLRRVAERFGDRNLSVSLLAHADVRSDIEAGGFTVFEDPSRAVRAAKALSYFGSSFSKPARQRPILPPPSGVQPGRKYTEAEGKELLASASIPVTTEELVQDADAAVAAAERIGYPVVLKIVSPDIAHKSDVGGVVLNIGDEHALRAGYAQIMEKVSRAAPQAHLSGILVAAMVPKGLETVLGVVRDPLFGPIVMFGLGGIFVEVLKDVVFRPAPFGLEEAREMITELRASPMFEGVRGAPPADTDALAEALSKLSIFAAANVDTIASVEINPFIVRGLGQGAIAVDAFVETVPAPVTSAEGIPA